MKSSKTENLPVLVVDDDSALIRTLADILRIHGYSPETAETATEGLRMAGARPPALAVVDLRLPDMDGMELVSKLHALSELTEVVVLTGNASVESAIAALREHSVDYLLKPVKVDQLLQVVSVATERWQRRQAEQALLASEERYRMLFDGNPQPVWVFDLETLRFLAVNDAAVRHYGYTREEFLGMTTMEIRPEEDRAAYRKVAGQQPAYEDRLWRHMKKDGTVIDVSIRTQDLTFAHRPARIVLAVDVTAQRAAERALELRARQQAVVAEFGQRALVADDTAELLEEAVGMVSRMLDVPKVVVLEARLDESSMTLAAAIGWNDTAVHRMAFPIIDASQAGYAYIHREPVIVTDRDTEQRFPKSVMLGHAGVRSGMAVVIPGPVRPHGVLAAHDVKPRPFTHDDTYFLQSMAHILGSAIERNRTDAALRQAQRMEAVGRLAGGVAHDFNNMLTAITGYGEMLRSEVTANSAAREDVEEILKAARRAADLTRQLLAFSRQQVLQPRPVDLSAIVADMDNMLRRLIGTDIEFVTLLEPELALAKADPGQIQQVIMNLCVNARDAMPDGGTLTLETGNVTLDASHTGEFPTRAAGDRVMLAVTDSGIGMDAETKARIYEPFFTTKAPDKGTGLGLATVYGIVKQSGGDILVYSEPGEGTTFKVYLPVAGGVEAPRGVGAVSAPLAAREATLGATVLLVDDEEPIRRLAQRVLEQEGYRVLVASHGTEALAVSDSFPDTIDLLVTDMILPTINGRELAERVRAKRPGIAVLYLSGYTDATVTRKGLLDRGASFLQKPFTNAALTAKARELLQTAAAGRHAIS